MPEMFDMFDFDAAGDMTAEPLKAVGTRVPEPMDCLRCGICLGSCPTYQLTGDEAEGPRQRIRTLAQMVIDNEAPDREAIEHLQNCLQCRACEALCPSQMQYGLLFDQAQEEIASGRDKPLMARVALHLIANKQLINRLLPLVWLYRRSGLQWLLRKSSLLEPLKLDRADRLATTPILTKLADCYPVTESRGRLLLFSGCIGDRFDRETLQAAIVLLNRIGYSVELPDQQSCCGAIHLHNGEKDNALKLMRRNAELFGSADVEAVIYCATGCGSQLVEMEQLLEGEAVIESLPPMIEICQFLEERWPEGLELDGKGIKIAVHEPCSQRNLLKNQSSLYTLLENIDNCEIDPLPDNHLCCGSGGSYMLTHSEQADALAQKKWGGLVEGGATHMVSTNLGCLLHLESNCPDEAGVVLSHPVVLLKVLLDD